LLRNKYSTPSGRHGQVDEHLLSGHAYSDKYGGSTTLLRYASAIVGDHKSSMLDKQYVIPLEDLCPYHQHVHLVASQPALSPHVEQTIAEGGASGDDYRISPELELPDRSLGDGGGLSSYDRLPVFVSGGFTTRTTAAVTRNSRISGSTRRSFVTFKPQSNIVTADSPEGAVTVPTGSCVSLDLIKPLRASSTAQLADSVVKSQEYGSPCSTDAAVGCVSLMPSSAETYNAV